MPNPKRLQKMVDALNEELDASEAFSDSKSKSLKKQHPQMNTGAYYVGAQEREWKKLSPLAIQNTQRDAFEALAKLENGFFAAKVQEDANRMMRLLT
jgi:hypothetical protein